MFQQQDPCFTSNLCHLSASMSPDFAEYVPAGQAAQEKLVAPEHGIHNELRSVYLVQFNIA